ncbi:biotin transport system permease protein [Roseibium hamelinense]|uniref:Biotin transport system permease protein n=1 Tax=Roseibium hamelinense TaxID=150831 RepID=A0A562SNW8_9HYPH|nr:energy-coupling factor transporter transmembrane component T [Roseibium hamelinense]MTI44265.1 energy-coupling factor transporter transmembrane protein EcfT [Roseibium hamelinense]TWI82962.1 biotin transport system permease protein [Roseibium hamelinense]
MISVYLDRPTWAHRRSAGMKLGLLALCSVLLLPQDSLILFIGCLAGALTLYASLGRDGLSQVLLLKPMIVFFGIILVFHGLFTGWQEGFVVVLRLIVMVLLANFVSITTRMDDMMDAVMPLFVPLKWLGGSPRTIALAVALVLRFVPVLMTVYGGLSESYRARGGKQGSWRLIAPFALQSLRLSENVAEALSARGGARGVFEQNRSAGRNVRLTGLQVGK